jgi:hypothetical protein
MRIAFDLDDTLIPCGKSFPVERPTLRARWLRMEPLRLGSTSANSSAVMKSGLPRARQYSSKVMPIPWWMLVRT